MPKPASLLYLIYETFVCYVPEAAADNLLQVVLTKICGDFCNILMIFQSNGYVVRLQQKFAAEYNVGRQAIILVPNAAAQAALGSVQRLVQFAEARRTCQPIFYFIQHIAKSFITGTARSLSTFASVSAQSVHTLDISFSHYSYDFLYFISGNFHAHYQPASPYCFAPEKRLYAAS